MGIRREEIHSDSSDLERVLQKVEFGKSRAEQLMYGLWVRNKYKGKKAQDSGSPKQFEVIKICVHENVAKFETGIGENRPMGLGIIHLTSRVHTLYFRIHCFTNARIYSNPIPLIKPFLLLYLKMTSPY